MKLISMSIDLVGDCIGVVEHGWWLWKKTITYKGKGTVWHNALNGCPASPSTETLLTHAWTRESFWVTYCQAFKPVAGQK